MKNFHDKNLQEALIKAAKVGNVKLMSEFIAAGADPFLRDETERNAISYALARDPENTALLLIELTENVG